MTMLQRWTTRSMAALAAAALMATTGLALAQSLQPPAGGPPPLAPPTAIGDPEAGPRKGAGRAAMAACRADAQALCANVEGGRGARIKCLVDNRDKASADCRSALEAVADEQAMGSGRGKRKDGLGKRLASCQADYATFCATAGEEGGGRMKCLRQNEAKLSPECKATVEAIGGMRKRLIQACAGDRATLCAAAPKGKETLQCLIGNEPKLSPDCKATLAELPAKRVKQKVQ